MQQLYRPYLVVEPAAVDAVQAELALVALVARRQLLVAILRDAPHRSGTQVDPFEKANFETRRSHFRFKG
jgi:hypothetical protein